MRVLDPAPPHKVTDVLHSRAGRFGTKGLAITFVTSDGDQQVMAAIQSRFTVAVPELPDHIDPASYSMCFLISIATLPDPRCSDVLRIEIRVSVLLSLICVLVHRIFTF